MNYKLLRKLIKPITHLLWPVTFINKNKFIESKGVYICNHYSYFDPVPMYTDLFTTKFHALMKAELCNHKFWGKVLMGIGGIPVKRGEADFKAMKQCLTLLRENEPLLVFPEGTRNKSGSKEMIDFKEGPTMFAMKTQAPVVPMLYYKPIKFFRRTYLIIGSPICLQEFSSNERDAATEKIKNAMQQLRTELDSLVENKKALRALLKQQKQELREIRKKNKEAKKLSKKAKKSSQDAVIEE